MKERLLQYIWQHGLFDKENLKTIDGDDVRVIKTGQLNTNAGPDFFNARVLINDTMWAGNVEIHEKASDWEKHNHNTDTNYDNVVLHVVTVFDKPVVRTTGEKIATVILPVHQKTESELEILMSRKTVLPCNEKLKHIDSFKIQFWLEKLTIDRLEKKTAHILEELERVNNNWEECFYRMLAKNFGFKTNDIAFYLLSKSLPLKILAKHKNNIFQIEALLFGQAGMLNNIANHDAYSMQLQAEYLFLQNKYGLQPIDNTLWKMLRMRPSNFPTLRIAQFAQLVYTSEKLFSKIIKTPDYNSILGLLRCDVTEYWLDHYNFCTMSKRRTKHFGDTSKHLIIINTIAPVLFAYGISKDDTTIKQAAITLLEHTPAEENHIIDTWNECNRPPTNAYTSQALIELNNEYCANGRCLNCSIGHEILKQTIKQ